MRLSQTVKKGLSVFFVLIISGSYFFGLETLYVQYNKAYALISCPEDMDPYDRLACLNQQASEINSEKSKLSENISNEQYEQLTLNQQILYLNQQIQQSETEILGLEVEIETKNVEIKILGRDIEELQNNITTVTQEVNKLQSSIDKRISFSYKYSFVSPVELILETSNFDTLLRKLKYLSETRKKDKELLGKMATKESRLKDEQKLLTKKKDEIVLKRDEIETHKSKLFKEKQTLAKQKSTEANLLAISKQKVSQYSAELQQLIKQGEAVSSQLAQLNWSLYFSGGIPANTPVKKGDVVGFQGHTGLAYGSHLHFELRKNQAMINPYSSGYFTPYNGNGSARFPMSNAVVSFPHWDGSNAIDMHSANSYLYPNGDSYYTKDIYCTVYGRSYHVPAGYYTLNGEGAPLYAIKDGMVTDVFVDKCGGKAVIVDYGNGLASLYLHLR